MLCLAQEIRGDISGIGRLISQYQDFARACNRIDGHVTVDSSFGKRHVNVSGADDLIDLRYRFRSVSHGGNGLCAADAVDFIRSGFLCGNQRRRTDFSVASAGRAHHDMRNACHFCGDDVHQDRGRIGRLPARDIDTHAVQRGDLLAEQGAVFCSGEPALTDLPFMVGTDIGKSLADDADQLRSDGFVGFLFFFFHDADIARTDGGTVELLRIGKDRLIPVRADIFKDLLNGGFLLRIA